MAKLESLGGGYQLWHYLPSRPAAIIFIIIFFILTGGHTWKLFRNRLWFGIPFVIGGLFEIIGYIGRVIAYNQTGELGPYIMQSTLLLIAPVLFAASLYMTLGRVITGVRGQRHALVSPRWTTGIFVAGDVISFLVQGSGAGLMAQTGEGSDPKMATNIITGGLVFQIIIFAIFVLATAIFHRRFSRDGPGVAAAEGIPWNQTLRMLYLTSALVMVRNIFRVAEFVQGNDGYLLSVEWPVYVFDAVLMSITMGLFYWWYPADIGRAVRQIGARNYPADDSEMMPVK